MTTVLMTAQKRILHACPNCGHLVASHDSVGCLTCPIDRPLDEQCPDLPPVIETTYEAVAVLLDQTTAGDKVTEYAIEYDNGVEPKLSISFSTYAEPVTRLAASAFTGRVVRRRVTTTPWEAADE